MLSLIQICIISLKTWRNALVKPAGSEFFFVGRFLIINSTYLTNIELCPLSISSYIKVSRFYLTKQEIYLFHLRWLCLLLLLTSYNNNSWTCFFSYLFHLTKLYASLLAFFLMYLAKCYFSFSVSFCSPYWFNIVLLYFLVIFQ